MVSIAGARIGGRLDCRGARLSNPTGVALDAEWARFGQDVVPAALQEVVAQGRLVVDNIETGK